MTIISRAAMPVRKMEVDLSSSHGNVFYLFAIVANLSKRLGLDKDQIFNEMKSGDFDNAISVFDSYFGDYVILYK